LRVRAGAIGLCLVLAGCAGDDPAPGASTPEPRGGARYDSLEAIADAADCKGLQDLGTANNAGLEEFGICYVGSANIDIYLTSQRGLWEHLADQFPSVLGPNWVIVSPSGIEGARIIQERLGGELEVPPSPSPS
jgi:hypothetical protein